ncbi:MAG: hypothetical protein MK003_06675 [Pseudomonadales bacterium]|nr:hypothetical protein [Pseudomonadales bacterium]
MHRRKGPSEHDKRGSGTRENLIVMMVILRHTHSFFGSIPMASTLLVSLAITILLLPKATYAQEGDSLPDWSGVCAMNSGTIFDRATVQGQGGSNTPGVREHPPYNAEYEAKYLRNLQLRDDGLFPDPLSICGIPSGFPRIMNLPDVYEFAVTRKQVWIIAENGPGILRIYTDGREHPDPEMMWPTHTGDSVGHWDGDTLVFDTVSLHSSEEGRTILDRTGLYLSDAAHIITRMRKLEETTIEAQMTIEDSKALTGPWVVTKTYRKLEEGTRVYDYACAGNNRNPVDIENNRTLILGPDGEILNSDIDR